jgi:iron complex outermembrane receptor protein
MSYQYDPEAGFYNLMPAHGMVLPNRVDIPRSFNPSDPDFDKYHKRQYSVGYSFEHRFNEIFSVNQNFRYWNQKAYIRGLFADNGLVPPAPNGTELGRFAFFNDGSFANIHVDNQGHAKFDTGPLRHHFMAGLDFQKIRSRHVFMGNFCDPPTSPAPCRINIRNPVYGQPIPYPNFLFGTSSKDREYQIGLYAQDQIRLSNWVFLIGGREDWVKGSSTSLKFFDTTKLSDHAFTWRAGVVYLFEIGLAPYFSYSESFQPELGSDFFGNPFKPTTGNQYEIGIKYQPRGVKSFITLAAFHIKRQNVVTDDPDPDHPFASVQTGEVRSRGIELEGHASLTNNLELVASYTFTNVKNTKSNTTNLDKAPTGIPKHSAALWTNYKIPIFPLEGLQLGAGVRFVGRSFGDAENTFKVPSYTLVDAALRYDLAYLRSDLKGWQVGVSGTNIFDKTYVSQCLGLNDCSYGLARRVLANVTFSW